MEDSLTEAGFAVQRVFGNARDDTPVAAYRAGTGWGETAVVVWAGDFSDMMSIAPLAHHDKAPLFLTDGDDRLLNSDAVSCIASGGFTRVIFAGGTSVVPDAVRAQLEEAGWNGEIVRLWGNNAYDTNASIAQWLVENNGFSYDEFALATGESFVDGASGVAFCGVNASPLLLASDEDEDGMNCINSVLTQDACRSSVLRFNILGGTSVISGETRNAVLAALGWL